MIISLSHTDLDGSGAQIVLANTFSNVIYYNASYGKIQEYLEIVEDTITDSEPCVVFITDLMFKGDDYDGLINLCNRKPNVRFFYIDHHTYDFELKGLSNLKIIHSLTESGTMLTYNFLHNRVNPKIKKLIECINAFDLHLVDSPYYKVGFVLNELFWFYKQKLFFKKFREPRENELLNNKEKEEYKAILLEKDEVFSKCESNGTLFKIDNLIILSFLDKYFSFFLQDYDFEMYVNIASYGGVSVRFSDRMSETRAEYIRNKLLTFLDEGDWSVSHGGHVRAWGISLKENDPTFMLKFAEKFLLEADKLIREEIV